MQPYVPQSSALPPPTAANRPVDPNVQTLVGQLLMAQQQQPAPAPGQELQGVDGEPIRPEATRALAQVLGATSQAGAQNLLQMTGAHQTRADAPAPSTCTFDCLPGLGPLMPVQRW